MRHTLSYLQHTLIWFLCLLVLQLPRAIYNLRIWVWHIASQSWGNKYETIQMSYLMNNTNPGIIQYFQCLKCTWALIQEFSSSFMQLPVFCNPSLFFTFNLCFIRSLPVALLQHRVVGNTGLQTGCGGVVSGEDLAFIQLDGEETLSWGNTGAKSVRVQLVQTCQQFKWESSIRWN